MAKPEKQVVTTPSLFKVDDKFTDERFMRVRIAVMHSGENLNKSDFSTDVIRKAKDTFGDIPVLANIISYTDENGETHLDYGGHDAHIEEDAFNADQYRLIYDEKVVGHVPSNNHFEIIHDDESGNDYVYVDAYLYREYGNYCCDILEARGGMTDVSAEIYTDEVAFDAQRQVLVVNKMTMSGVTLLGENVNPAMKGAHAEMFSISEDNLHEQMIQIMKELKESLDKYAAAFGENEEKGGEPKMNKFDELLEKYGKTAEEIDFEYEGLSDEELEAAFDAHFSQSDPAEDPEEMEEDDGQEESDEEDFEESNDESLTMSIQYGEKQIAFSVSLRDKINALYQLVNDTYADDCTWYDVDVYDDEKYVIMVDYMTGRGYKQNYRVKKDVYTLVGDRVEVFAKWLTQDEINKLDKMKTEYSEISEELKKYHDEPKKLEILQSDDYSLIANDEKFIELQKQDNHFNLSIQEVTEKADAILTEAAKKHKFSAQEGEPVVRPLPKQKKNAKRFGSLFEGII